jgi:triacylglycerol lipase
MSEFVRLDRNQYPDNALDSFTATRDYKLDNARAMMWLSQLAYETDDKEKVKSVLRGMQLELLGFIHNDALTGLPPRSACVIIAEGHGATFVTFAGSDPGKFEDWVTDFHAMPTPDGLHSGFDSTVTTVWDCILTALKRRVPTQPLFFTGHSLGGALAILSASRAALLLNPPPIVVYTFGSPRVGGDVFFKQYGTLGDSTFRVIDGTDLVATVPPTLLGFYRHVGQAVQCDTDGVFDGIVPMPRDNNKPDIIESAEQAGKANLGAFAALQLIHTIGPSLRDHLAGFLPRMIRDHVPASYFKALSITVAPPGGP